MLIGSGCGEPLESDSDPDQPDQLSSPQTSREGDAAANPTFPAAPRDAGAGRPRPSTAPDAARPDMCVPPAARDAGGPRVADGGRPRVSDAGLPAMFCTGRVFGDGKTCATLDLLTDLAAAACGSDGLELMDMKIGDECEGGATTGWASCCSTNMPVPAPPDAGVVIGGDCMGLALGGRNVCMSHNELRQIGYDVCAAQGLALSTLTVGTACPGGALNAYGACCPAPEMSEPLDDADYLQ